MTWKVERMIVVTMTKKEKIGRHCRLVTVPVDTNLSDATASSTSVDSILIRYLY